MPGPNKQLEVKDASSAQLRLTQGTSYYTDFTTDGSGNLTNVPIANVGIGSTASSPTATLHVFGNEKINTVNSNTANFNYLVYNSSTKEIESNNSLGTPSATVCSGTSNLLTKYTGSTSICNSQVYDDGTHIGVATTSPNTDYRMDIQTTTGNALNYGLNVAAKYTGVNVALTGSTSNLNTPYPTGVTISNPVTNTGSQSANYGVNALVQGSTNENIGVYGESVGEQRRMEDIF